MRLKGILKKVLRKLKEAVKFAKDFTWFVIAKME
jgi:hypothetical protein